MFCEKHVIPWCYEDNRPCVYCKCNTCLFLPIDKTNQEGDCKNCKIFTWKELISTPRNNDDPDPSDESSTSSLSVIQDRGNNSRQQEPDIIDDNQETNTTTPNRPKPNHTPVKVTRLAMKRKKSRTIQPREIKDSSSTPDKRQGAKRKLHFGYIDSKKTLQRDK